MIALVVFRIAAYVRSHRVFQALLPILVMISIVYASRAPRGAEAAALTDSAVLVIPFLAWAARGLLDTEPDEQRAISATGAGGRLREVAAGLLAALVTCTAFAALTLGCGLMLGLSATPSRGVVSAGVVLHGLAVLAGVALGALTSRPVMPSPAYSVTALVAGFLMMLLVGASPAYWLTVPVTAWMKAAGAGRLVTELPGLTAISLAWCLAALTVYGYLRRSRP
ncbi:hypothetical protein HTZ77_42205 [Nonomuraea sp. SMC257]|uniref:ABC transporter permease n=1 Tax=Nonomuraea montanisoli TaxID=2741721 RepID=A0A7Y6M7Y0_9ACTN|nr:hypothetical protein [Nonomuraea montanisoli]NUW37967.1 hypothetical protein [Nonomuraea montanisoli]